MKKKLVLALIAPMMCLSLVGCHSNVGMKLTYGTYLSTTDSDKNDAVKMSYAQLSAHMEEDGELRNENFLLTIAPVNGCVCWAKFQGVLKQFIKETKYLVYQINCDEFGDNNYGLTFQDGHVSFAIIKGGTIIKQYMSHSILESTEALKAEVNKFVKAPELYYVDEPFLNEAIKNGETALVEYIRSGCSDCNYVSPNIIWPYAHQNTFKTKMYVIDLQDLWLTRNDSSDYQNFKNNYLLSNVFNEDYGYDNGVVPTLIEGVFGNIGVVNEAVIIPAVFFLQLDRVNTRRTLRGLEVVRRERVVVLEDLRLQVRRAEAIEGTFL